MFHWKFTVTINNEMLTKRMERRVNQIMKRALYLAVKYWRRRFLRHHFTRAAYGRYPAVYVKRKKEGDPLKVSGTLERQIVNRPGHVTGTSKSVTLHMALGRPAQYHGEQLDKKIVGRIVGLKKRGIHETWKQAEAGVLKKAGYGPALKKYFRKLITAVRGSEQQAMAVFMKKYIAKQMMKKTGQKVQYTIT